MIKIRMRIHMQYMDGRIVLAETLEHRECDRMTAAERNQAFPALKNVADALRNLLKRRCISVVDDQPFAVQIKTVFRPHIGRITPESFTYFRGTFRRSSKKRGVL